jgi:hypothetical protein
LSIEAEFGHLAGGCRSPVAERALERTAAIGFPKADPLLVRVSGHQIIEDAVQERRRQFVQVAHPFGRCGAHEIPRGVDVADAAQIVPVPPRQPVHQFDEGLFTLVVDDQVDERMIAQEALGMIGYVRPAEDHQPVRMTTLDAPRRLERDLRIPHIGAEADDVGAVEPADDLGNRHPLVDHRQK